MITGPSGIWVALAVCGAVGLFSACGESHEFTDHGPSAGTGADGSSGGAESGVSGTGGGDQSGPCSAGDSESCYESADGMAYSGEPPTGQATCRFGERKCQSDGTWGVCVGAVAPEAADTCDPGNDANCNGLPNEGCTCDSGETRACGTDEGNCVQGEQTCTDNAWGTCEGEVKPGAADSCVEGDDANCDGTVNDGCECVGTIKRCSPDAPDDRQACSESGVWLADACAAGSVCRDDGDSCKLVDGEPCTAPAECDTSACSSFYLDDDEDGYRADASVAKFCGTTKEGYVAVASSLGDDCNDGVVEINPGETEICDGADNDCDNLIDIADTGAGLALSGTAKVIEGGLDSAVASSGSIYGIAFNSAGTLYFTTLNQGNAIVLARKVLDTGNLLGTAVTWNGSSFGIFYRAYGAGANVSFRRATPAGAFSPATAVVVGNEGIGAIDPSAAYMTGQGYFYTAWGNYISGQWVYGYGLSSTDIPSNYMQFDTGGGRYANVAASGDRFGVVWNEGIYEGTGSQVLQVSIRNASNAQVASTTLGAATLAKKAAIAARAGGGFAVLWNESSTIKYQEISATGATLCGPISRTYANFLPDQMVPTQRGFLAVSGNAGVVKLQEVLSGCTFGSNFPSIGTGSSTVRAHIAGGTSGFAVVWDQGGGANYIYARTFGPNLCD